jgi:hypothetical protein
LEADIGATEPYQDFLFAMNSPVTRERYSTRLRSFFVHIGIEGTTMEERCRKFIEKVKESEKEENGNGKWVYTSVIIFLHLTAEPIKLVNEFPFIYKAHSLESLESKKYLHCKK